ncbi:MAG: type II secretion system protein [Planctomycetes bacterium]|nr:type II secretion system protein [Planctomycetota bacterium]
MHKTRDGFTLIELLVVMSIISILASLLLPALSRAREQAISIKCMGHLRQLAISCSSYADTYNGVIPMGSDGEGRWPVTNKWTHLYWNNFYDGAGLGEATSEGLRCPKVLTGVYGMTNDISFASFTSYPFGTTYSTQPYSFKGCRISKVMKPTSTVFFADSAKMYTEPGPLQFERNGYVKMGGNSFCSSYIYQTGVQVQGIWLAHENATNTLFADFHAKLSMGADLLKVDNPNKSSVIDKKGIDAYWDESGAVVNLF